MPLPQPELRRRFEEALENLEKRARADRSILAMILCGSLSHDTVWEKSDIDLVFVTIDEKKLGEQSLALVENDVNIHATLVTRAEFRAMADGARRNSFVHSFLSKGRLLYSHDPSIEGLFSQLQRIGSRDTEDQLLRAGIAVLPPFYKAQKWFYVRGDLHYAALWVLYAATPLAQIEVFQRGLLADREVVPQAAKLNPSFFRTIYFDLFDQPKTEEQVKRAIEAAEVYLRERRQLLYQPVIDYLKEAGEVRSVTEIEYAFKKHRNIEGVSLACEYLADEGAITKAAVPVKLTRKSTVQVNELAFVHLGDPPDAYKLD